MKIKAILQSFDVPNRNKRFYSLSVMKEAIERFLEMVKNQEAFGELGHPKDFDAYRSMTIHPQYVSHIIKDAWLEENILKGIVEPVGPYGKALEELVEKGKIGFSARIYASQWIKNKDGYEEPRGNIHIICYDAVILPSHKEAYVESVIYESTNISENNNNITIPYNFDCKVCNLYNIPTRRLLKL